MESSEKIIQRLIKSLKEYHKMPNDYYKGVLDALDIALNIIKEEKEEYLRSYFLLHRGKKNE